MKLKTLDFLVTKVLAVAFLVAAFFIIKPQSIGAALPIIAVALAIFIIGLPISVSVWRDQLVEIMKAKFGGAAGAQATPEPGSMKPPATGP